MTTETNKFIQAFQKIETEEQSVFKQEPKMLLQERGLNELPENSSMQISEDRNHAIRAFQKIETEEQNRLQQELKIHLQEEEVLNELSDNSSMQKSGEDDDEDAFDHLYSQFIESETNTYINC